MSVNKLVGLAVVTYKDNFGSALQTYATQKIINKMGYETCAFDISNINNSIRKRKIRYYFTRLLYKDERKYIFANANSLLKKKKNSDNYSKNMSIRHSMYKDFYAKNIQFFPVAKNWKELSKQSKQCEMVVVGSDQLWGAANIAGGYFTLEFVPNNIKKIAYSTSFGVADLPKQLYKKTSNFLNRIEYLSVREVTGQSLIKKLTGKDIPVVCDPTMLLTAEEWMEIQNKEPFINEDYILTYFMGDNPEQREWVKRLRKSTGYKIVGLLHGSTFIESDELYCDETPYNVGPGEFLNLIRNAKYICTDSFHCSVFSILYGKEFFAFPRDAEESSFSANDRLHTLLGWTELTDRFIKGDYNDDPLKIQKISYNDLNKKVERRRLDSLEYLRKALEG